MTGRSVIVIGAGLGGIAAAARLARHHFEVRVFEKCDQPGGRCGRRVIEGHTFDTGPTLFLMRDVFEQTFSDLGEDLQNHICLQRVDPSYRIHFHDGSSLGLTSDLGLLREQIEVIEPGSYSKLLRYLGEAKEHYQLTMEHIVSRNFYAFGQYFNLRNLKLLFKLRALRRHINYVRGYFKEKKLQEAFTFQDMYLGISPYHAPATYSLLQHVEFANGVWFPMGGMYRIVEALESVARESGVLFEYQMPVAEITTNGQHATGVRLEDGSEHSADIVIANADLPYVYRCLLPDDGTCKKLDRKEYSFSALTYLWGLGRRYPQFEVHNLFLSEDNHRGFQQIFKGLTLPDDPSFYVHAPLGIDPSLAPPGEDTLIVIIPVGHLSESETQDWEKLLHQGRAAVLKRFKKMGIGDIESFLKFEESIDPRDWLSRFNLMKGSPHGLSYNLTQVGYLRPHNRHACFRNLYFVGASTHPGTGLPMVLISARLTTERILRDTSIA